MIRQVYEVRYNEEAKQMEENFKSSFNGGQLSAINCDNKEYNVMIKLL